MAERLMMIALSPTMEEGTILKWKKKEGESFVAGDPLCEVETDKASMDYESPEDGVLLKVIMDEGAGAKVGDTIAIYGEEGEDFAELLAEIESESKAAPAAAPEAKEEAPAVSATAVAAPVAAAAPAPVATVAAGEVKASPLARKLADQKGYNIGQIPGTGPGGRVVKRDVENFTPSAAPAAGGFSVQAAGTDRIIPVSGVRGAIARKVTETKFSAPHFYIKSKVAMDNLMAARGMLNKEAPQKVSFNAFIIKFVAEALKRHPGVNASWQGDKIIEFGSVDIALAVDLGNGLMMPIVRNAANKGILQIDAELKELIEKVRQGTLKPDEYTGATFSISNLGSFGVDEFTAILNEPGAAILALGKMNKVPVFDEKGNVVPENQMVMTLSCDHRAIDGSMGGRFLSELQKMMENPVRVLF